MIEKIDESSDEIFNTEEVCCRDTSCCAPSTPIIRDTPKIGRNDPCICGNGRKFKKCCGINI
jgi:uncharacterized protein YecA (UPF0149 family)